MNGRVIFNDNKPISYDLFQNAKQPYNFRNSLAGIQDESLLSKTFFSQQNINNIQRQIVINISKKTGYKIARQSETELQIIMRSIFLQYSKNLLCNIKDQIYDLNEKVLNVCIDRITTGISQFLEYKNVINKLPQPLSHPKNLSNSGSKTLSPNHFIV